MENLSFLHDNLIILIKATLNESKGKNTDAVFSKTRNRNLQIQNGILSGEKGKGIRNSHYVMQ